MPDRYTVAADCNEQLRHFFRATRIARLKRFIDTAIRRFGYALDRQRVDDRLVDLLISAESLYLTDAGNPRERGELRFRLALRAARFIETERQTRAAVFGLMKQAYDARSVIVHGGEPGPLRDEAGVTVTLEAFTALVEALQRAGLHRIVEAAAGGRLPDWNALVLDLPPHKPGATNSPSP